MSDHAKKHAKELADWLMTHELPRWAEGEECGIYPKSITRALDALGLELRKKGQR